MQVVVKHELDDGKKWFIHNTQNGHEYCFSVMDDGSVSLKSSSQNGATHKGEIAIDMLDSITSAMAREFADLNSVTKLKYAMIEASSKIEK